jgi:predicted kinase
VKAILTVGISCSGKTNLANEMVVKGYRDINRDWIRFNVVQPGQDWRNYKFNRANETEVTRVQNLMIMESYANEENIIISDTNLNAGRRTQLVKHLEDLGYEVELFMMPIGLEEAWKRDSYRLNGVGHDIIYRQWQQWNDVIERKVYVPNENQPKAIIVDIDGTVADMKDYRGPFDWSKVHMDEPRKVIIQMVRGYKDRGYRVIMVSGRSDDCLDMTALWLDWHLGPNYWDELHMRKADDYRKDNAVKEEIFWTHLAERYNIVAAIDDRPQVLRLWLDLKIPNVISVGNPYLEF